MKRMNVVISKQKFPWQHVMCKRPQYLQCRYHQLKSVGTMVVRHRAWLKDLNISARAQILSTCQHRDPSSEAATDIMTGFLKLWVVTR